MAELEGVRHEGDGRPADGQPADRGAGRDGAPPKRCAWLASLSTVLLLIASLLLERGDNAYLRVAGVVTLALSSVFIFAPFFLFRRHGQSEGGGTYMQTQAVVIGACTPSPAIRNIWATCCWPVDLPCCCSTGCPPSWH